MSFELAFKLLVGVPLICGSLGFMIGRTPRARFSNALLGMFFGPVGLVFAIFLRNESPADDTTSD